ncbi:MAG: ABC transporter permease [Acidobacteria bacterium]|nr:ABC transporter permease [Acidobacteriota bacterium]
MINRLILANLVNRPIRTLLSVAAVALEVVLIIMVVGLSQGVMQESARRTAGVGAEIMVQPQTTSMFLGFSGSPMPVTIAAKLAEIPEVRAVAPVLVQASTSGGITLIYGIDVPSFDAVSGGFRFLDGRGFEQPDDVLVDDIFADSRSLKVGSTLELLNQQFRVAGIVEHGKGARIFLPIEKLQDLMGSAGKASIFFVRLTQPKQVKEALAKMQVLLPNYQLRDMQEYVSLMVAGNVPGLSNFISVIIGLAVCIGLLVIFITMYSTIIERTREIGILKAMGASRGYVFNLVLRETATLTVFGIIGGIGLSYAVRQLVGLFFPTLPIVITSEWMLRAAGIALFASLFGSCYPAMRAAKQDAIEALAYE